MEKPVRFLHLEDDLRDAELAQSALKSAGISCEITLAQTSKEFEEGLSGFEYDIILADYSLPGYDGISALRLVREHDPAIPFIFISGTMGEDAAIHALTEGATDYVLKHKLSRLVPAVRRALQETAMRAEHQRAQEALVASEKRFRALVENGSEQVSILSADARLMYENPSLNPLLGYEYGEFQGMNLLDLVHPDDLEFVQVELAKLIADPPHHRRAEFRLRHRDGTWRWVEAVGTNLLAEPAVQGIVINYHDITERRQAEEQIRYQALLLENVSDVIVSTDLEGLIRSWNRAAENVLGYKEADVIGKEATAIVRADYLKNSREEVFLQLRERGVWSGEVRIQSRDGQVFYTIASASMIRDNRGKPIGFISINHDITERKRAAQEIESLAKFPQEDTSPVLRFARDGELLYANPASRSLLDLWGCEIGERPPEEIQLIVYQTLMIPMRREIEITHGDTIDALMFIPIVDKDYVNVYGRDITERKRAEEALRDSETRYRTIMEKSLEAIYLYELDTKCIVAANPAFLNLLGYDLEEALALALYDIVAEDRSSINVYLQQILSEGGISMGERLWRHKNGTTVPVEVTANKIQQGEKDFVFVVARDISERKQAEEALRKSEKIHRLVVRNINEIIYRVSVEDTPFSGAMQFMSPSIESVFGYQPHDFLEEPGLWLRLIHPDDRQSVIASTQRLQENREEAVREYRLQHKTTSEFRWIEDHIVPLFDDQGNLIGVQGVARDITAQKKAEEVLHQSVRQEVQARRMRVVRELLLILALGIGIFVAAFELNAFEAISAFVLKYQATAFDELITSSIFLALAFVAFSYRRWREVKAEILERKIVEDALRVMHGELDLRVQQRTAELVQANESLQVEIAIRKEAEEAEREAEVKYRTLIEQIPAITYITTLDEFSRAIYISPHISTLGFTPEEWITGLWVKQLHPDDRERVLASVRESQAMTAPFSLDYRILSRDGQVRWFHDEAVIVYDAQGRPRFLQGVWLDITERKMAEERLHQSEEQYRSLFEDSPLSLWVEDFSEVKQRLDQLKENGIGDIPAYLRTHPDFVNECADQVKILDVNSASTKLYHAKHKSELLGSLAQAFQRLHPEQFEDELIQIANGRLNFEREGIDSTMTGEEIYVNIHWSVAPGYEQSLAKVIVAAVDVTERKQRERELEAVATINAALRTTKSLEEMLPRMVDHILSQVQAEMASIWLYDEINNNINLVFHQGWRDEIHVRSVLPGEGIPGLVVKSGEPIISREFRNDPRVVPENREFIPEGIGGICLPLHAQEQVIGVMFINVHLPREINTGDVRILNALAEICGSAIHRMRLHEQTVKQLERLSALRVIDRTISGSVDLRLLLDIVLEQVSSQLGIDAVSVLLARPDSGRLEFAAGRGFRTPFIEATSLRLDQGNAGRAAFDKTIIHIEDLTRTTDQPIRRELLAREGFVSYFAIPLIAKGVVIGVMELFHRSKLRVDMEWLNFMDSLGWQTAIAVDNAQLFEGMQRSNFELEIAYQATIEGWSKALDLRDKETEGHTKRVTEMTVQLARAIGVQEKEILHIQRGALLHDIGKMGVPDSILLKPDKLTEEEWEIMRKHPVFAYEMLSPIAYLRPALDIPYRHHEKWDGTGYPRGLKGEQIPLAARLFAVVDVWDALTSDRPYRKAWSKKKALDYIKKESGKHFDRTVVEAFLKLIAES